MAASEMIGRLRAGLYGQHIYLQADSDLSEFHRRLGFLMALLFVAGVMNPVWVSVITLFVLAEKLTPTLWIFRIAGLAMGLWGIWMLVAKN